jgi:hypothetical protein
MSRANHSHILFLLDRSGSMGAIKSAVIEGFNAFITSQREVDGTADFTLIQFDDKYEAVFKDVDLSEVPMLTDYNFIPRGMTALLDAMGRAIDELGGTLRSKKEADRPEKVIVAVLTDGQENASVKFTQKEVRKRIEHQQSFYNWEFMFLSADPMSLELSREVGFKDDMRFSFNADAMDTKRVFSQMSSVVMAKRAPEPRLKKGTEEGA